MDIPAIQPDTSMPSSNDSVVSAPTEGQEASIVRSNDSVGHASFNENAIIVQVDSNLSGGHHQSRPTSPQRPAASPSSAQHATSMSGGNCGGSVAGSTVVSGAASASTPTRDDARSGNPFDTAPAQPVSASVPASGNPFDSPNLKFGDSVFQAYDHSNTALPQRRRQQSKNKSPPISAQPLHISTNSSQVSSVQSPMNASAYRQDLNPAADGGFDENSHGDTVGSTVTEGGAKNRANTVGGGTFRDTEPADNPKLSLRVRSSSLGEDGIPEGVLICGFLQKLGRNGKWQTRWFETDGECLSYYKSSQRTKLLATLDLTKVGSIVIDRDDPTGCSFVINISDRPYKLRADGKVTCTDWVITLNRVKEARNQEGNVKLVIPTKQRKHQLPPDLLSDNITPRVVVVANRERTRAVNDIDSWEQAVHGQSSNPASSSEFYQEVTQDTPNRRLARWQKPRTSMSRLARKVLSWARSLRGLGCTDARSQVELDHHLHPPGHDDPPVTRSSPKSSYTAEPKAKKENSHATWIGKETSASKRMGMPAMPKDSVKSVSDSVTTGGNSNDVADSDEEPRELS